MSEARRTFRGFPAGARATLIPNVLFSDVLPAIEDPAELVVSVYVFFVLGRKRAGGRWVTPAELATDPALRRALDRLAGGAEAALQRGLAAAVCRGTLLRACAADDARYVLNDAAGRRALALPEPAAEPANLARAMVDPPTIYALYEENIGTISPLIADELRAAEEEYPQEWVEAAFREAVSRNRRSWRYVARILERWRDEGRDDAAVGRDSARRRDLAGRYRHLIRR